MPSCCGPVGETTGVGGKLGVGVAVGTTVGAGVIERVGVGVGVAVAVGVGVIERVGVTVAVGVDVTVGVGVGRHVSPGSTPVVVLRTLFKFGSQVDALDTGMTLSTMTLACLPAT